MGWGSPKLSMMVKDGNGTYNTTFRPCGLRQMSVCVCGIHAGNI